MNSDIVFPQKIYSWTLISPSYFIKEVDRSVFHHHGTVIPMELHPFFEIQTIKSGDIIDITLKYNDFLYPAKIEVDNQVNPRARLFWKKDLSDQLNKEFPGWYDQFLVNENPVNIRPGIGFEKVKANLFSISFISEVEMNNLRTDKLKKPLIKYGQYSRKEVHDIFDPYSNFTVGSGTWGNHGIIKIPFRENDFVFFVTFGQEQAGHIFKEEVTEDGILSWQSQPHQDQRDPVIQKLVKHNHYKNSIYLFLRTNKRDLFTFLGRLAYISHDYESKNPVYFKWQILDWELTKEDAKKIGLELVIYLKEEFKQKSVDVQQISYTQSDPPLFIKEEIEEKNKENFYGRNINYAENDVTKKENGLAGELYILEYEKKYLIEYGRPDLAEKVIHTSVIEGDGAGYDILSFSLNGESKYIEVKTTSGGKNTPFILTANELAFSKYASRNYFLYRVYKFNKNKNQGEFFIVSGDVSEKIPLEPIQYRCIWR